MKKIKLMLFSIALLAITGGAVAFKIKGTSNYCTAEYDQQLSACPHHCPNLLENASTKINAPFVCTTKATTTTNEIGQEINTCVTINTQGVPVTRMCAALTTRATVD